jgi:hypothetical protein
MPTAAAAAKIAALQSELAASQAALLKLEQELTSQQYKVEVRLQYCIAGFLLLTSCPVKLKRELTSQQYKVEVRLQYCMLVFFCLYCVL